MRSLLDVVAPVRCAQCGSACGAELCADCAGDVQILEPPLCDRCGASVPAPTASCDDCRGLTGFSRARSLVGFVEPARAITLALKRRGRRPLARSIGDLLGDLAVAHRLSDADAVTFVPGGRRARGKGFDHARLIASSTAAALGIPLRPLVVRSGEGPRQADVPFIERANNVRHRFKAKSARGAILLVDDVLTTGATADACSRALLDAGATRVDVITWARAIRRRPRRATWGSG